MTGQIERGLFVAGIHKNYGSYQALKGVDLEVREGEFFTLLGPSGCGKTTLLRIIAGLDLPNKGCVFLGGQDITSLPAAKRQVNTVFQSYALFPHLNIYKNVAFGLKARNFSNSETKRRVADCLVMLGLEGLEKRYPHELSGGQKQRVAIARALVNEPDVLLLDEPMSALDARLRTQVQEDLRRLQRSLGQTFILVTHDQDEAMVVSDRLAVMRDGLVEQTGTPEEVYSKPRNKFVAEFLGDANLLKARRVDNTVYTDFGKLELSILPTWDEATLTIRPENIKLGANPVCDEANWISGRVREAIYRGQSTDIWLDPGPFRVRTHTRERLNPGDQVSFCLPAEDLVVLEDNKAFDND